MSHNTIHLDPRFAGHLGGQAAMGERISRRTQQSRALAAPGGQGQLPQNVAAAQARIAQLEGYISQCQSGYAPAQAQFGYSQAAGLGGPKSTCLIDNAVGAIDGFSTENLRWATLTRDDSTGAGDGDLDNTVALTDDFQADHAGKMIGNLAAVVTVQGSIPSTFDNTSITNFVINSGKVQVIHGSTANPNVKATVPLIQIVASSQFPKAGLDQPIRLMPGVWSSTKFKVSYVDLPPAVLTLDYDINTTALVGFAMEPPGLARC